MLFASATASRFSSTTSHITFSALLLCSGSSRTCDGVWESVCWDRVKNKGLMRVGARAKVGVVWLVLKSVERG